MERDYSLSGKKLFKAIYRLSCLSDDCQKLIICDSKQQAEDEIESFGVDYFTLDLIQDDISLLVLNPTQEKDGE